MNTRKQETLEKQDTRRTQQRKVLSTRKETMSDDIDVLPVVLYFVFSVLVLFSNSIVIIVIIKSRELHLPTLWNIAFMAAWDLALGLHFLVFIVPSKILNAFVYTENYGKISGGLFMFIITQNILNVLLALVDRYIAIAWPLKYQHIMSAKRFTCAVTCILIINIIRLFLLVIQNNNGTYDKSLGIYSSPEVNTRASVTIGFYAVTVSIIVTLLIQIRLTLGKSRSKIRSHSRSLKFTYTIYLSTLVYIVCYIPSVMITLINIFAENRIDILMQVGLACVLSNSLWNVFIYAFTYRPFRNAFVKLFCPTFFRERARREVQCQFKRNRTSMFTVEDKI